MSTRFVCLAVLAAVLLGGCKNREKDVVGTWTATQNGKSMTMTVKADKTWASQLPVLNRKMPFIGTWSLSGDTVNLAPTKLGNQTVAEIRVSAAKLPSPDMKKQVEEMIKADDFILSEDGKTMTLKDPKAGVPSLTFTKG